MAAKWERSPVSLKMFMFLQDARSSASFYSRPLQISLNTAGKVASDGHADVPFGLISRAVMVYSGERFGKWRVMRDVAWRRGQRGNQPAQAGRA